MCRTSKRPRCPTGELGHVTLLCSSSPVIVTRGFCVVVVCLFVCLFFSSKINIKSTAHLYLVLNTISSTCCTSTSFDGRASSFKRSGQARPTTTGWKILSVLFGQVEWTMKSTFPFISITHLRLERDLNKELFYERCKLSKMTQSPVEDDGDIFKPRGVYPFQYRTNENVQSKSNNGKHSTTIIKYFVGGRK